MEAGNMAFLKSAIRPTLEMLTPDAETMAFLVREAERKEKGNLLRILAQLGTRLSHGYLNKEDGDRSKPLFPLSKQTSLHVAACWGNAEAVQ
eukprot:450632-Prorocentrum_minimum.AAC.2